jgi:hypothetical protein
MLTAAKATIIEQNKQSVIATNNVFGMLSLGRARQRPNRLGAGMV